MFHCPCTNSSYFSVLVFMSTTGRGFQIEYPAITLHAVSRAATGPSIYCQLDEYAGEAEGAASNDEMSDMRELSIVPQSAESRTCIRPGNTYNLTCDSGTNIRGLISVCSAASRQGDRVGRGRHGRVYRPGQRRFRGVHRRRGSGAQRSREGAQRFHQR